MGGRRLRTQPGRADFAITTDAATSTAIIAVAATERVDFATDEYLWETRGASAGPY